MFIWKAIPAEPLGTCIDDCHIFNLRIMTGRATESKNKCRRITAPHHRVWVGDIHEITTFHIGLDVIRKGHVSMVQVCQHAQKGYILFPE